MSDVSRGRHFGIAARIVATLSVALVAAACSGGLGDPEPPSTTAPPDTGDPTEEVLIAPYARSGWPTQHADSANDRHVPTAVADGYELLWSRLNDAPVLSTPTVGADGRIFVTTALGPGFPNLHAFDAAGSTLWESDPWTAGRPDSTESAEAGDAGEGEGGESDPADGEVDSCAGLFSPVADDDGDLYVTDCDQLWAFRPTGEVKWVIDLPEAPARSPYQEEERAVRFNPLSTLMIQAEGELLGTTVFGQVIIVERETGEALVDDYALPALPAPPVDVPLATETLWAGRDIDPEIVDPALQLDAGGVFPTPNAAAQDNDGNAYVVARSDIAGGWMVYAVRVDRTESDEGSVFVTWSQTLGDSVASSPALSDDRSHFYIADRSGAVRAVETEGGVVSWVADVEAVGTPVAVFPDGLVIAATEGGDVVALTEDGDVEWTSNLAERTASIYRPVDGLVGPTVRVVGAPVVTDRDVVVSVEVSYGLDDGADEAEGDRQPVIGVPVHGEIVALDPDDGDRRSILATRAGDGNGQVTMSTLNGVLVTPNSCARSTATAPIGDEVRFRVRFGGFAADDYVCGVGGFRPSTRPSATS